MGGSSGGQNGIKSIIQHLGTPDFARVKVGIGRPPGRMDAAAYVLQNFSSEEGKLRHPAPNRLRRSGMLALRRHRSGDESF